MIVNRYDRGFEAESSVMTPKTSPGSGDLPHKEDLARARAGDDAAFSRIVEPLRRELRAHCYRMLGSIHDADDALQDALVRAWRAIDRFEGRGSLRSWLYSVATRTCLDSMSGRSRRALPIDLGPASLHAVTDTAPREDVAWLGPYPDSALPSSTYEVRESVELAFIAALQDLPGNQRAALVLFEVLGFSVGEIAEMMDTSTASINSALQRARTTLAKSTDRQQVTLRRLGDDRVRRVVTAYATALSEGDADGLVALLTEDVTWSMPPLPHWYRGLAAVTDFAVTVPLTGCGSWRYRITRANGQPAAAFYLWDEAAGTHLAWSITVLTLRDDRIRDLTSFLGRQHFPSFGLPDAIA
ncbi:RNA polymerase ECF family sigma subunit [Stackebrandtia endophytica]|uniref:RNA polymerase ECF family sigma subunit n=2 Tax=Stackebrandtia endophytica TaxID=1496996 RepID=A0A543AZY7_9ACTN|nr:RNA polymerase ECF family sigma subunit [Stackebrandtia endophytica]